MNAKLYGFKAERNFDTRKFEDSEKFSVRLDLCGKDGKNKAIWLYETNEAAEEALRLAKVMGIEIFSGVVEYDSAL